MRAAMLLLAATVAWADVSVAADVADGDRAVAEIERMTAYHDHRFGPEEGRGPGDTWLALKRILDLGPAAATPRLKRLARSRSAVARMAAARGLVRVRPPDGAAILRRLIRDHDEVELWMDGCAPCGMPVSTFALRALEYYSAAQLYRRGDVVVAATVKSSDRERSVLEVEKVLAGRVGRTITTSQRQQLPVGAKVIAYLDGDLVLRMWFWSAEDEAEARRAVSTSGRPMPPAP